MMTRMMKRTIIKPLIFLLLITGTYVLHAQDTLVVNGIVKAGGGTPVPNVALSVEGSAMLPVITDSTGAFSLTVPSGNAWIIVSPTGEWKQRRIYLNMRSELTVYLSMWNQVSGDDPLLVLNMQRQRRDMSTAFSEPDMSTRHHTNAFTVDEFMEGNVSGMHTVNRSSDIGSGAVSTLRGVRSIYANNEPLYVVDGIPINSLNLFSSRLEGYQYNALLGVNAFDVSAITVVKDPVYSAAYGSKGSNGLIFIQTLDPSVTQTTIDVDARIGYSRAPSNQIPQLSGPQHRTLMNELLFSTGQEEEVMRERFSTLFTEKGDQDYINYQHSTNWQDLIYDDAFFYNLNFNVKGGDEIARYGLSFGYMNGDNVVKNTGFTGYNLRFVSLLNIFTWLKMDAGVALSNNSSSLKESAIVSETSPIMTSLAKSPLLGPYQYDAEGNQLTTLAEVDGIGISNPLAVIENYEATNTNYNFTSFVGAEFTINREFSILTKLSYNYDVMKETQFLPNRGMELYENDEAYNISRAANNSLSSFYNNTYMLYQKDIGTDHSIVSNTGMNIMSNSYEFDFGLTKNAHPNDEYRALGDGQNNLREIGGANRDWTWISFYENVTYDFRDKYLLTASMTLDGSSRVGDEADNTIKIGGQPYGLFYSAGLAWRVSNESFMRNLAWLEEMKLRLSAGKVGNDDIGESSSSNYYQAVKFRETVGLYPALLSNDNLSYETVTTINGGVDLSFLGNRFMISVDYFVSTTNDMIIYAPVEAYFGYDFRIENGGKMHNSGLELSTFLRVVDASSFKWDIKGTFSRVENEISEIKGDKLVYNIPGGQKVNQVGYPANSFYGYVFEGVNATAPEIPLMNDRGMYYGAGDAIYKDISGPDGLSDGIINEYDKTIIGSSNPDFFGGLTTVFTYKRFSLSGTLQYVLGPEVFNYVRYKNERMVDLSNQSVNVLNRWQHDGQETNVPRAVWDDPMGNTEFSSRWIEDGSYLRVKNITVSYRVRTQFLFFRNAEVYVSANNLFTMTDYLGYDPEFAYSHSQIYQGVDYGLPPHVKQFIAGIKIGL